MLGLGERASVIYCFYLHVATCQTVHADPPFKYTEGGGGGVGEGSGGGQNSSFGSVLGSL